MVCVLRLESLDGVEGTNCTGVHHSLLKESFESMVGLMVTKTNEFHVVLFPKLLSNI